MRAGSIRNFITIQTVSMVENANLELVETPTTFKQCWAEIKPLEGREYWASKQTVSEVTATIKIRYIAGVTTKMKVIDGAKTYDILAVLDTENRHIELVLLVKET